jgi:hypothetical protein
MCRNSRWRPRQHNTQQVSGYLEARVNDAKEWTAIFEVVRLLWNLAVCRVHLSCWPRLALLVGAVEQRVSPGWRKRRDHRGRRDATRIFHPLLVTWRSRGQLLVGTGY